MSIDEGKRIEGVDYDYHVVRQTGDFANTSSSPRHLIEQPFLAF